MKRHALALATSGIILAGCGSADSSFNRGGFVSDKPTAPVTFNITDAPIDDATSVVVTAVGLRILETNVDSSGNEQQRITVSFGFEEPLTIDLLTLQGTNSQELLKNVQLPIGDYSELRLVLSGSENDNTITFEDGRTEILQAPGAAVFGLSLRGDFTVEEPGNDFTVDIDLRQSITEQEDGSFLLEAASRIVDNANDGSIAGDIDPSSCGTGMNNIEQVAAVYVYEGADITPFDYGTEATPLTSVKLNAGTATGVTYEVGFLPANEYTVTLVCNAVDDAVGEDNQIIVTGTSNVTVTAGSESTLNFGNDGDENNFSIPFLPF